MGYSLMPPLLPPPSPPGMNCFSRCRSSLLAALSPAQPCRYLKGGGDFRGQKGDRKTPPPPPSPTDPPVPPYPPPQAAPMDLAMLAPYIPMDGDFQLGGAEAPRGRGQRSVGSAPSAPPPRPRARSFPGRGPAPLRPSPALPRWGSDPALGRGNGPLPRPAARKRWAGLKGRAGLMVCD